MSLTLPVKAVIAACVYLGLDIQEGTDPNEALDDALAEYNLDRDQFMTQETLFACGYHRGLSSATFNPEDQVPSEGDTPDSDLARALEDGFACGLEARDLAKTPPPSLVFAARAAGELEWGTMAAWAAGVDLSDTFRLGHAVEVGAGKTAVVIPAGTPVDILADDFEKDGVAHTVVSWDGLALLVPNPADAPKIVTGDTEVASTKKRGRKSASGTTKPRVERGPTLKTVIIEIAEGKDGGPGPLQNDGAFAGRVLQRARELNIGDKATKFVAKAAKHVPYYLNCYKPGKPLEGGDTPTVGRLGVEAPLDHVIAAIEARKYYLRADGTHEEKLAAVPEELAIRIADREATVETVPLPKKEKAPAEAPAEAPEAAE